ncbi:MAG: type III pantothenate kinase [Bacilli bacterium]
MLLCIDMGNTMIKFGVYDNDKLKCTHTIATDLNKTIDEYALNFKIFLKENVLVGHISDCILSSVVPSLTKTISAMVTKCTGINVLLLQSGIKTGLTIKIDQPKELGSDLVADAVGAVTKYGYPIFIVDLGTANKIFAVDRNGIFIGGVITIGVGLSLRSLSSSTSLIPSVSLEKIGSVIGKSTKESVSSGIFYGTNHLVRGLISDFIKELGYDAKVVLTGGNAQHFRSIFCDYIYDENLSIDGLAIIYKKSEVKTHA